MLPSYSAIFIFALFFSSLIDQNYQSLVHLFKEYNVIEIVVSPVIVLIIRIF